MNGLGFEGSGKVLVKSLSDVGKKKKKSKSCNLKNGALFFFKVEYILIPLEWIS